MAIAPRQGTGADAGSVTTSGTTLTLTGATAGDSILVVVRLGSNTLTAAVTDDKGGTYTALAPWNPLADATNGDRLYLFLATNAAGGTTVVTCTPSGTSTIRWCVEEIDPGAGSDLTLDQTKNTFQSVIGTNTADSGNTATTTVAAELCFGFCKTEVAHTISAGGTGYTFLRWESKAGTEYKVVSSTGAYNSTFVNDAAADSSNANSWAQSIATFSAVARAGGTVSSGWEDWDSPARRRISCENRFVLPGL